MGLSYLKEFSRDYLKHCLKKAVQILCFRSTVKLDFKNRQDKNQPGFKNQITNDQLGQISFKNRQDKNNLTLRTKMAMTRYVLKVKFDCTISGY